MSAYVEQNHVSSLMGVRLEHDWYFVKTMPGCITREEGMYITVSMLSDYVRQISYYAEAF